jgi:hypothetical protein
MASQRMILVPPELWENVVKHRHYRHLLEQY